MRKAKKVHFAKSRIENGKIVGKRYKTACNLTLVNDHIGHASFNRFKESLEKFPNEVCKNCQREYHNFLKEIKEYKGGKK
jgi:hypothetical protein